MNYLARLLFNESVIGYRFKLLSDLYDMPVTLYDKVGLSVSSITKSIQTIKINEEYVTSAEFNSGTRVREVSDINLAYLISDALKSLSNVKNEAIQVIIEDSKAGREFYLKYLNDYKGELVLDTSLICQGFRDVKEALRTTKSKYVFLIFDFALDLNSRLTLVNLVKRLVERGVFIFYYTPLCFEEVLLSCVSSGLQSETASLVANYTTSGLPYVNRVQEVKGSLNTEQYLASALFDEVRNSKLSVSKKHISQTWYSTISPSNSILGGLVNILHLASNRNELYLRSWSRSSRKRLYGGALYVKSLDK